jgi:hypothetical protein
MGAALGTAEGLLEESFVVAWCGALGGLLFGFGAGLASYGLPDIIRGWSSRSEALVTGPVVLVILHLGVGLSLAAGRWVRDIPRRRAARAAKLTGGAPADAEAS